MRWDGATWARVALQKPKGNVGSVFGVDATASNDAWAVGYYIRGVNLLSYILHWDGSTWVLV